MTWSSRYPRVKEVLAIYDEEGIDGIFRYYSIPGMVIPDNSWHSRIAKSAKEGRKLSLNLELNSVIDKLKYSHDLYENPPFHDEIAEREIEIQLDKLKDKTQ